MKLYDLILEMKARHVENYGRLSAIKAAHPEVKWYPFHSEWKLELLSRHLDYFKMHDVASIADNPRVIDVGAADGDLAFLFEMVGCQATAVDYPHTNYNRCRGIEALKTFLLSNVDLEKVNIDFQAIDAPQRHDIAIFLDVLYHLKNPIYALVNLLPLSDYLFISTRIFETTTDLNVSSAPLAYLLRPFEAAKDDPTNYWMFTERGFETLLGRSGWDLLEKSYFGYEGHDSDPSSPGKDKRVVCLCKRKHERGDVITACP
jgi:tRNA (mo5U34)-methyltransferase